MFSRSGNKKSRTEVDLAFAKDSSRTYWGTRDVASSAAIADTTTFDELFHRHYDQIYGLLFRLVGDRVEAEDLVQEAFIKLNDHLRGGHPVAMDENIGAWLYRVAMNLGYNALRSRKRLWERNVLLVPDDEPGVERQVGRREERAAVRAALARLPERQALLLILRQMEFSYGECAEICDVATGSVGTLLARAAEAFRREFLAVTGLKEDEP